MKIILNILSKREPSATNTMKMRMKNVFKPFIIYFIFSLFIAHHLSYFYVFLLVYTFIVKETQLESSSACLCQILVVCFFTNQNYQLIANTGHSIYLSHIRWTLEKP